MLAQYALICVRALTIAALVAVLVSAATLWINHHHH